MTDALTLYKLIILYMLDRVDFPLTNSQISEFILEQRLHRLFQTSAGNFRINSGRVYTCENYPQ